MSPDIAASVRARLLNQAKASGEEFQLTLTRFAAERLLFRLPELATRWRSYLAAGAVLTPPPAQFATIGEGIIAFLGPVRRSIIAGEAFDHAWAPRGPWSADEERTSG
jgi:hypothetical protein